jgi:predicted nucleotidyltransferase component of viral defense system
MPRLSVDIDLTYLSIDDRETALKSISDGLGRIKADLEKSISGISVTPASREGQDVKINCQIPGAQIKIEVNTITRGSINQPTFMRLHKVVEETFGRFAAINVVSMAELFGGKVCAALDRQHPRDLFDVKPLLDNEGLSNDIMIGFLVALLSHMRPINESIRPKFIDQRHAFETQFSGMADIPFSYEDFERTREQLVNDIHLKLTEKDRLFLMSFKEGIPDWEKFIVRNAKELPAINWKLQNIIRLKKENSKKHKEMVRSLERALYD